MGQKVTYMNENDRVGLRHGGELERENRPFKGGALFSSRHLFLKQSSDHSLINIKNCNKLHTT